MIKQDRMWKERLPESVCAIFMDAHEERERVYEWHAGKVQGLRRCWD